jgi:hypothetical protein
MNIWSYQRRLVTILLGWAVASIVAGLALSRREESISRGIGEQFAGWGAVNAAIAIFGGFRAERNRRLPEADAALTQAIERRKLSRLLWLNTGLDVFYILGGVLAARKRGATDARWRGRGLGIIIQGGFLFFFDLINAVLLGRKDEAGDSQL